MTDFFKQVPARPIALRRMIEGVFRGNLLAVMPQVAREQEVGLLNALAVGISSKSAHENVGPVVVPRVERLGLVANQVVRRAGHFVAESRDDHLTISGRQQGNAFATGAALSDKFIAERPDVARRFALAWARAVELAKTDSSTRGYLIAGMKVPPELAATIPLANMIMVPELSANDQADFQKFLDIGQELGVIKERMDAKTLLKAY